MTGTEQIESEVRRLRTALAEVEQADPLDAAVIETLDDGAVREVLAAILDEGATLAGVALDQAGTVPGLVQLTFVCEWLPGTSHVDMAPAAVAIVETSPPRVLRVARAVGSSAAAAAAAARFQPPAGPLPPVIGGARMPAPEDVLRYQREAGAQFARWREGSGIPNESALGPIWIGTLTGSYCSTLFCFERYSDDWD